MRCYRQQLATHKMREELAELERLYRAKRDPILKAMEAKRALAAN